MKTLLLILASALSLFAADNGSVLVYNGVTDSALATNVLKVAGTNAALTGDLTLHSLTSSNLTASALVSADANKKLNSVTIGANLNFDGTTLSGSGAQTPWAQNIDGAGYAVTNSAIQGQETWIDFALEYAVDTNGITDCTELLQSAVTRALSPTNQPHAATIYFRPGYYLLGGSMVGSNSENAQVIIPLISQPGGGNTYSNWSTIRFLGPNRPATWEGTSLNGRHASGAGAGAVIGSSSTSAGSVFATQRHTDTVNPVTPVFENLTLEHTNGFAATWMNFTNTICLRVENVSIHHANGNTSLSAPTAGSMGIDGPKAALGNVAPYLNMVNVSGLETGIRVAEHTYAPFLNIVGTVNGLVFKAGTLPNLIGYYMCQNTAYPVGFSGISMVDIQLLAIERGSTPAWGATVFDVNDPSNQGRGKIRWKAQDNTDVNKAHKLGVTGGQNLAFEETQYYPMLSMSGSQSSTLWLHGPAHWYVDNTARAGAITIMKSRGTMGVPTVPSSGDGIGEFAFAGLDAAAAAPSFQSSAAFLGVTDGSSSSGSVPIAIYAYTGVATSTRTNRWQMSSSGVLKEFHSRNVSIGVGDAFTLNVTNQVYCLNTDAATVTLPTAVGARGRDYKIKLIHPANTGTIATTSSQLIDGAATYSLTASNKFVNVVSDGTNWWIIASN